MTMLPGMSEEIWYDGEEWKHAVFREHNNNMVTLPNHFFSRSGRFASNETGTFKISKANQTDYVLGTRAVNDTEFIHSEKASSPKRGPQGSGKYYIKSKAYTVKVSVDLLTFPYHVSKHQMNKKNPKASIVVRGHIGMMNTWKPIDKYPPKQLADDWDDAPESFKQWVRSTAFVDHTKTLPDGRGDTSCNHIDFLEWSKPGDNNFWVKKAIREGRYNPDDT